MLYYEKENRQKPDVDEGQYEMVLEYVEEGEVRVEVNHLPKGLVKEVIKQGHETQDY